VVYISNTGCSESRETVPMISRDGEIRNI